MSNFGPLQAQFVSSLAHQTGLDPQVVGAWALAEQSGSAAKYYEDKQPGGYNNFLNIANTDSGPASGANSSVWRNPETAATATANWLKGEGQIAKEYGAPAQGIRNILNTSRLGPQQQIQSIAHSGWASSGYDGGATLQALYGEINPSDLPSAQPMTSGSPNSGLPKLPSTALNPTVALAESKGSVTPAHEALNSFLDSGSGGSSWASWLKAAPTSATPLGSTAPKEPLGSTAPGTPEGGASKAVDAAAASLGKYAASSGHDLGPELNQLEKTYGMEGEPWCAMAATTFVSRGGSPATKTASVAMINQWADEGSHGYIQGRQASTPQTAKPGDLLTFGNAHVAFVKEANAKGVVTIEGNADGSGGVVQLFHPYGEGTIVRPKYP
jgi:hypothetical protein